MSIYVDVKLFWLSMTLLWWRTYGSRIWSGTGTWL